MPKPLPAFELSTTLSLGSGDQRWGSERRMALLAAIDTEGSISAAARKVGISYKAAWDAVDMMNNVSGGLLVERTTGGRRGGGAQLTDQARHLVSWYQAVQAEHQRFTAVLSRFGPDSVRHLDLLHSMALQTSARNRFAGTVTHIASGPVNDQVTLQIAPDTHLLATVTRASTQRLALAPGRRALAFIKAQAVQIHVGKTAPDHPAQTATNLTSGPTHAATADGTPVQELQNHWAGPIADIVSGEQLSEITLAIGPDIHITGMAARTLAPSPASSSWRTGQSAYAAFQATDVLIGTLD